MADSIFINYRRDDAGAEAGLIATALRQELGHDSVFMDTSSLEAGARWPETVRSTLDKSTIVVAVIGPDWLRISDEWGRRRIDQDHDWVRQELARALADSAKLVIPVLVSGARIPPENVLPEDLRALLTRQVIELRRDYWHHDVQLLLAQLQPKKARQSLEDTEQQLYPVNPPEGPDALSSERIERLLKADLTRWKLVVGPLPEDQTVTRFELFREFRFKTFQEAIGFMSQVAPGCDIAMHHPRWENIWRTVRVFLTTWDIGHRISDRDVQLARYLDRAYAEFYAEDRRPETTNTSNYGLKRPH